MRFSLLLLAGIALALMATGDADAKEPEWNYTTEPIGPCCGLTRSISVDISADGEYTAVGGYGKVYLFDKYSNIALWSYDVGSDAYSIAISADGEYIVAGSEGHNVYFFDKNSNTPLWNYTTGNDVESVAISADGEYIIAGSNDHKVYLFDKDSNTPLWNYTAGGNVRSVAISADGEYIVAGSHDHNVYLFNKNNNTPLQSWDVGHNVNLVDISANGEFIIGGGRCAGKIVGCLGGWYDEIYQFDKDNESSRKTFTFTDEVSSIAISADGKAAVVGSIDGYVHFYTRDKSGSDKGLLSLVWGNKVATWVASVAISAGGEYIGAGSWNDSASFLCGHINEACEAQFGTLSGPRLWNYTDGSQMRSVAISADGRYLAAGSTLHKVYLFHNKPPTAIIDSITPSPARFDDMEVVFNGTGIDSDSTIVAYEWTSDIDGFLSDEEGFNITGFSVGTHTISFRVRANDGEWSEWDNTTLVVYPNAPPVATGGSDVGHARFDDVIVFSGSGSDSDGSIVAYEWTSDIDGFLSSEKFFNSTGFTVGNHTISFRVQDNDGDWSDWEASVLVISNTTACSPSYSMYLEKYVFYSLDEIDIWIDFKCLELNGLNEFEYYVYPINDPNDIMWSEAYGEDSWNINQESFTKGDQSIRRYKPAGYYHIVSELKNGGVVQHYDVITFCIKADDFDNACSYGSDGDGSGGDGSGGGGIPPLSVILTISAWVSLANIAIAVIALRLRPE